MKRAAYLDNNKLTQTYTQESCSIQIPYYTGTELATYYDTFVRDQWELPEYDNRDCEICGAKDCAKYNGFYTRQVLDPGTGFSASDFPVMRYYCRRRGKKRRSTDVTFSLLPVELVPYRKLTLVFMVMSIWIRIKHKLSLLKSLDVIIAKLPHDVADFSFVYQSALMDYEMIMKTAMKRLDTLGEQVELLGHIESKDLLGFVEFARKYESQGDKFIRGPPGLAWDYSIMHGKHVQGSIFLFGDSSQDRRCYS